MTFDDDARRAARDQFRLLGGTPGSYVAPTGGSPVACTILARALSVEDLALHSTLMPIATHNVRAVAFLLEELDPRSGGTAMVGSTTYRLDVVHEDDLYVRTFIASW